MSAVPSGRASSISSIDGDDMMAIDSLCNNTPQVNFSNLLFTDLTTVLIDYVSSQTILDVTKCLRKW